MSRITELRAKQEKITAEARERLDQIGTADEGRAKELEAQHDAAMAEYDRLDVQIKREEKVEAMEKRATDARAARRPNHGDDQRDGADNGDAPEYRDAFWEMIRAGGNAAELSPEMRAVLRAGVVDLKGEKRIQSTSNSAGGYTVPVTLANFIIKSMAAWGPMYDPGICTEIQTSSGEQINIPTVDDTAVPVVKHTEGTALTDDGGSDVTFGSKALNAYVYDTEFVRWSLELAQDSIFSMEQLLGELLGERLGRRANTELTTGDGSGDPNGIVTASSLGVTAASATAIKWDEIIDLEHSVDPAYRGSPKARFMFADTTLKHLRKLKDGEGRYLWSAGDVSKGVAPTLNGRPYSINQAMAAVATGNKAIIFGDFGKYYVRKVGSPIIGVLRERFWPDLGIAGLIRLDGELGDTAAVKHLILA